jgi:hypothetical protein
MGRQTEVVKPEAIRFGSGKFEVYSDSLADWVNLGAMRDIVFEESWEKVSINSDNAGVIRVRVKDHVAALKGSLMEVDLENLELIRGGLDNYSTVSGSAVPGATQIVTAGSWAFNTFVEIANQNGDGSAVTINSVMHDPGGVGEVEYVEGTDYIELTDRAGNTGIIILDATNALITHSPVIDYDYTPNAARVLSSGGYTTIEPRAVRVTNLDEEDKMFRITVYKADNAEGIALTFPPDDGDDPMMIPITLEGTRDTTRAAGDQLFEIYDEQSA